MQRKDRILRDSPAHNKDVRPSWNEYKWRLGHETHNWTILYSEDYLPLKVLGSACAHGRTRPSVAFPRANLGQEEAVRNGIDKEKGFIFLKNQQKEP